MVADTTTEPLAKVCQVAYNLRKQILSFTFTLQSKLFPIVEKEIGPLSDLGKRLRRCLRSFLWNALSPSAVAGRAAQPAIAASTVRLETRRAAAS